MSDYDAFDTHLRTAGYRTATRTGYAQTVRRWRRSGLDAAAWLVRQRDASARGGPPTASASIYRSALLAWAEWRRDAALAASIRAALPKVLRYSRPRVQTALSPAEEVRLLAVLPALPPPVRALTLLALRSGLRSAEVRGLRFEDVETGARGLAIRVRDGKGGKARTVPLDADAAAQLAAYLRSGCAGRTLLFPGRGGRSPYSDSAWAEHLAAVARRIGVARLTPHTLRHTYGTRRLERGVPAATVAALMGHADIKTTSAYAHIGEDALWDAARR